MEAPVIIAHRTSPAFAPENSLEGIRVSFEQDADGVEIDLRASLDLRLFLMHDNSMHRTTAWVLPIELTPSAVVRRQRLLGGSESVPSLREAIDATPSDKLFAVDVKTPWSIFGLERTVKAREMQARTLVWCSSALVVRYALRRMPGVEVAHYKDYADGPNNIEFIGKAGRIGAHAVSLDWRGINKDVVAAAHSLGLKVYSWHKEHPLTAEKLSSGLDGLITDHPARSRAEIAAL
jgi:glycerophosphoryl diester phosphodiesterase